MTASASAVQAIVDSNCNTLLDQLQHAHPGAAVGISVALYYPGNTAVPGFFPYGQAAPGTAITPDTVYAIGSVTKVFTATLAAYLQVKKVIDLKTTHVGPYLSNTGCQTPKVSGSYWNEVPFWTFATHTSGMPDEAPGPYSTQLFNDESPSCDLIQWWDGNESQFAKMQGLWNYSSAGFVTLGFATVQAASEKGYPGEYTTLLSQVITGPNVLDMPYTFAANFVPDGAQLAQGYDKGTKQTKVTDAEDLKSSAGDLLIWLAAVYQTMQGAGGGNLTDLQQAILLTTDVQIAQPKNWDKQPTKFAMGLAWQIFTWQISPSSKYQVLTKNGATSQGGCSCWVGLTKYAAGVPAVGIALMTNQIGVDPDPTARTILQGVVALG